MKVNLASEIKPIQTIYTMYKNKELLVNRRYQRKLVWTLEEKQKLIESILNGYPVPNILLSEVPGGSGMFEIIDGMQRLHSIISFIEQSFAVNNKYFNLEYFPTALQEAKRGMFKARMKKEVIPNGSENLILEEKEEYLLSSDEVSNILNYTLSLSIMRSATEQQVDDVFDRINTYGHRLSDQERRQAGVNNAFSELVRDLACSLRGDTSEKILPLNDMPQISIDLPKTKHGYNIQADNVFWVAQGILRSTELRDGLDEQCIADITSSIILGETLHRKKDALDKLYQPGSVDTNRIISSLNSYGSDKLKDEFKYCIDEILQVCNSSEKGAVKLRNIIFINNNSTNSFPNIFYYIFLAFHELFFNDKKKISNYSLLLNKITNISSRIKDERTPEGRRENINVIKACIQDVFTDTIDISCIYGNYASIDIDNIISKASIETSSLEFKQGCFDLKTGNLNKNVVDKVINTICAIANNAREGIIMVGVSDDRKDAMKIQQRYGITAKQVGERFIVGIEHEVKHYCKSLEEYKNIWISAISNSALSSPLKDQVLSSIEYHPYHGLGLLIINIPKQKELSFVGDKCYWRHADNTTDKSCYDKEAVGKMISELTKRF